jgi:hypothetical protein
MNGSVVFLIIIAVLFVAAIIAGLIYEAVSYSREQKKHNDAWRRLLAGGFTPDKFYQKFEKTGLGSVYYNYLAFDLTRGLCALEYRVFPMRDVVRVEMLNDTTVVQSAASKFGGAGLLGVVVPGVAGFGGGSQSHSGEKVAVVAVRLTLDNRQLPSVTIPFLFEVADKASELYRVAMSQAYEVYGFFEGYIRLRDEGGVTQKTGAAPLLRRATAPAYARPVARP